MTISKEKRLANLAEALEVILAKLGDLAVNRLLFKLDEPAFEEILSTTWAALEDKNFIKVSRYFGGGGHFFLTSHGWLVAMEASGQLSSDEFCQKLGSVMQTLKGLVKGRGKIALAHCENVASEASVPPGFVWNIIDSNAIMLISNRIGAGWAENGQGRVIRVPVDFGHEPL